MSDKIMNIYIPPLNMEWNFTEDFLKEVNKFREVENELLEETYSKLDKYLTRVLK